MRLVLLMLSILACAPASAHDLPKSIESIYWSDGDSGWINGRKDGFAFRLNSIDAPETYKPKCDKERELGYEAKAFARNATRKAENVISGYYGHDRYDRHIIDLDVNGRDLGELGIANGHYGSWKHNGTKALEPRPVWCESSESR